MLDGGAGVQEYALAVFRVSEVSAWGLSSVLVVETGRARAGWSIDVE